jgi:dolichyl-phosphate beta-glucosyltransferase
VVPTDTKAIKLSLVLPAYKEAARLPPYLATIRPYLEGRYAGRYEVIVVDDGSPQDLQAELAQCTADWPELRWIRHAQNQGKGAAVRRGMLAARGEVLLFAAADGATPIEEESRLAAAIQEGADLAVGSRLLRSVAAQRRRDLCRGVAGTLFAAVARRLLGLSIRDTQCGFKIFRGEVGRRLFSLGTESRYLFDLELLALAQQLGYRIVEVPISWREVPGGHMRLLGELPAVVVGLWRLNRRRRSWRAKLI